MDDSTCGSCLELYTEPRTLNCGHAFCTLCLQDLAKRCASLGDSDDFNNTMTQQFIKCPKCGSKTYMDYRNVFGLPKNFRLANLADKERYALNLRKAN